MLDKNGIEIRTGDIVEITGAYFKNDNGLYYVEHSAGEPDWSGKDHCLRKISKCGKISTAKRNICFWPIAIMTNSYHKHLEGSAWNAEHAEIEVKTGIDRTEIAKLFQEKAENMAEKIKYDIWHYGEKSQSVIKDRAIKEHYEKIFRMILVEVKQHL